MINSKSSSLLLLFSALLLIASGIYPLQIQARTEEILDNSNNNLKISMAVPDSWNSGKLSGTIIRLDWKLNGLFATNFATKLFSTSEEPLAVFAVINSFSLVNAALPLTQKTGLLSMLLSQYVAINKESDLTLSDSSSAHLYSISVSTDQLHKIKAPMDKPFDAVLIMTQQHGSTYIVVYGTELGGMSRYQTAFDKLLHSVAFGSASFSGTSAPQSEPSIPTNSNPNPNPNPIQSTPQYQPSGPMVHVNPSCGRSGFKMVVDTNGFKPDSSVNRKIVNSGGQIPLYGYFQTNASGGFSDVLYADDLNNGQYKIYLGTDANNDNIFDTGEPTRYVDITIPCP